jgi:SSS family solute:Na+ symporter
MLFLGLVSCALWPTSVARALAAKDTKTVKKQFMFSSLSFAMRNIVPYFWGIGAFVLIMKTPELKGVFFPTDPNVEALNSLYALPVFMGRILPPVLIGVLTAAMLAAFMSTHDSYFLCWSSVLSNDVIAPIMGEERVKKNKVLITRFLIVLIGVAIFVVSFMFDLKQDLWDYMAVTGAIYFSGAFALLVGGLYWKGASTFGASLALIAGCLAVFGLDDLRNWMGIGLERFPWLTSQIVGISVIVLAMVAMVAGSLLVPDKEPHKTINA